MKQRIKTVLQGSSQSFSSYDLALEEEINKIIKTGKVEGNMIMPFPTSSSNGRLNTMLIWRENE